MMMKLKALMLSRKDYSLGLGSAYCVAPLPLRMVYIQSFDFPGAQAALSAGPVSSQLVQPVALGKIRSPLVQELGVWELWSFGRTFFCVKETEYCEVKFGDFVLKKWEKGVEEKSQLYISRANGETIQIVAKLDTFHKL